MKAKLIQNDGYLNNKKLKQHLEVVKVLSKSDKSLTIAEIASAIQISLPTTKNLLSQLIEQNWAVSVGKKETLYGRRPELFNLNYDRYYTLGILITFDRINLIICDINLKIIHEAQSEDFKLENNQYSLDILISFILENLNAKKLSNSQILGIGIGITGRVNYNEGISFNYLNFMEFPLKKYLEQVFKVHVEIENDTRVLGIAESETGEAKNLNDALIVNMDMGLGMSLIINGEILTGESGFAGEFGHMKFGSKGRSCICGNYNCLETEVSGKALLLDLEEALNSGRKSDYFKNNFGTYTYNEIINAAISGDELSIELINAQGKILGAALGNVINLLNPNTIIISGDMCTANSIFLDPVKIGIRETVLKDYTDQVTVKLSEANINPAIGSACLILKIHDLL